MRYLVTTILACALTGCGTGNFAPPSASSASLGAATYRSYGDSITQGYGLTPGTDQVYPYIFAGSHALGVANLALSGHMACDVPALQIFQSSDGQNNTSVKLSTLMIGTNDVDTHGTGAGEIVFNACHRASIAWFGVPQESKVLATSSAVKMSGATHLESKWNAVTTDAAGASASFALTSSAAGTVYVWYRVTDGSVGTFSYALDGKALGSASSALPGNIATPAGTFASLALLRIPGVGAGSHTLLFTQTSAGSNGAGIVAVAAPFASATPLPRVLVALLPLQGPAPTAGLNAVCVGGNTAPCLAYDADIQANVTLLSGDGLNVQVFDPRKYMTGTSADLNDSLHPNVLGQQEIAHALSDAY